VGVKKSSEPKLREEKREKQTPHVVEELEKEQRQNTLERREEGGKGPVRQSFPRGGREVGFKLCKIDLLTERVKETYFREAASTHKSKLKNRRVVSRIGKGGLP